MSRLLLLSLAVALIAASAFAAAQPIGNVEAGRDKSQTCIACHGATGASDNVAWPMLAGQHADYLYHALRAYKNGDRQNAIMNGQAAALSDRDMRDLAAFYAAQEPVLSTPRRESVNSAR